MQPLEIIQLDLHGRQLKLEQDDHASNLLLECGENVFMQRAVSRIPEASCACSPSSTVRRTDGGRLECFSAGSLFSIETNSFDEFCAYVSGWNIDHQLLGRGRPHIKTFGIMTKFLQLGLVEHSAGYSSQGDTPGGTFTLATSLDETRPLIYRGYSVDPLGICISQSGTGFELVGRYGTRHLVVSMSYPMIEPYVDQFWGDPQFVRHSEDRLRFRDPRNRWQFTAVCQALLTDVQRHPELLASARAATLFEEQILQNILLQDFLPPHKENSPNRYQISRRAYRYLRERLEDPPSILDLCAHIGTSYATLERGFRELYGVGPRAFVQAMRLSRARNALLHPTKGTTVTGVAMQWGFFELGRFSARYRKAFGEPPGETLRKARGESSLHGNGELRQQSSSAA